VRTTHPVRLRHAQRAPVGLPALLQALEKGVPAITRGIVLTSSSRRPPTPGEFMIADGARIVRSLDADVAQVCAGHHADAIMSPPSCRHSDMPWIFGDT
jgi:hypothetical protein